MQSEGVDIWEDSRGLYMVITDTGLFAMDKFLSVESAKKYCEENNYKVISVPPIKKLKN